MSRARTVNTAAVHPGPPSKQFPSPALPGDSQSSRQQTPGDTRQAAKHDVLPRHLCQIRGTQEPEPPTCSVYKQEQNVRGAGGR